MLSHDSSSREKVLKQNHPNTSAWRSLGSWDLGILKLLTKGKYAKDLLLIQLTRKINNQKSQLLKIGKGCGHLLIGERKRENQAVERTKEGKELPTGGVSQPKNTLSALTHISILASAPTNPFTNGLQRCPKVLWRQRLPLLPPLCSHAQRTFLNSVLQRYWPWPITSSFVSSDKTKAIVSLKNIFDTNFNIILQKGATISGQFFPQIIRINKYTTQIDLQQKRQF